MEPPKDTKYYIDYTRGIILQGDHAIVERVHITTEGRLLWTHADSVLHNVNLGTESILIRTDKLEERPRDPNAPMPSGPLVEKYKEKGCIVLDNAIVMGVEFIDEGRLMVLHPDSVLHLVKLCADVTLVRRDKPMAIGRALYKRLPGDFDNPSDHLDGSEGGG